MTSGTMYCNACGTALSDMARFCSNCGRAVAYPHNHSRLVRPRIERKIGGVCAGIAHHLDLDISLVRILWIFLTFASGFLPGVVAYILAWIIIPEELALPAAPYAVSPQQPVTG